MLPNDIMTVISNVSLTPEKAMSSSIMPPTIERSGERGSGVSACMRKTILFVAQAALVLMLLASTSVATMPPGPDDDVDDAPVCKMLMSDTVAVSTQHHYAECRRRPRVMAFLPGVSQGTSVRTSTGRSPLVIPIRT